MFPIYTSPYSWYQVSHGKFRIKGISPIYEESMNEHIEEEAYDGNSGSISDKYEWCSRANKKYGIGEDKLNISSADLHIYIKEIANNDYKNNFNTIFYRYSRISIIHHE